jgi:excisionase family DNA binding protein
MNLSDIHEDNDGRDRLPAASAAANLMGRPTLTVQETADLLGISRWLAQQAVRRGDLPVLRIGRRILIPRARLQALLVGEATPVI